MKLLAIGDIHGRDTWKSIIEKENPAVIVFIGDYFDSFDVPTDKQVNNFLDIIAYKESNPDKEVILLIGNHDIHYFPNMGNNGTSGYQTMGKYVIEPVIEKNIHHFQMCFQYDKFLFTHAGVSEIWLEEQGHISGDIPRFINELFKYRPNSFLFNGMQPNGDDIYQTPIWIRIKSLLASSKHLAKTYVQVVGHTSVESIFKQNAIFHGKYYMIDTLGNKNVEYLTIVDNKPLINTL